MGVSFTFRPGVVKLAEIHAAAEVGVKAAADVLLAASQPLVPVDTGALKASGKVSIEGLEAAVSYEGISDEDGYDYGIRQHEDMELHHPNGGQAKFLEQPMNAEHTAIGAALLSPIREVIGP
jgi:hypothetical protein